MEEIGSYHETDIEEIGRRLGITQVYVRYMLAITQ